MFSELELQHATALNTWSVRFENEEQFIYTIKIEEQTRSETRRASIF